MPSRCRPRCIRWRKPVPDAVSPTREHRPALTGIRLLFATAAASDRRGVYATLALGFVASLLMPLFPLLFKVLIDAATDGNLRVVTAAAIGMAVIATGVRAGGGEGRSVGGDVG